MKVWFKRVLVGVVAVFILALLGLAIFLLTFDPNAYKNKVQELVANRYQRTLLINGDISLSLFPRIGLSVNEISLSNRNSTSVFASIDQTRVAVAIWPLLSNSLVVDHISVDGFKVWVTRSPEGVLNFQDLIDGQSEVVAPSAAMLLPPLRPALGLGQAQAQSTSVPLAGSPVANGTALQIDIAGLDMKDGEVHFNDAQNGYAGRFSNVRLNTGRVTFDQPFDVTLSGQLVGDEPKADAQIKGQALLRLDREQNRYAAQKLNVQVSGQLAALQAESVTLQGNVAYSATSRHFDASGLSLDVQGAVAGETPIEDLNASLAAPQLKVDPSRSLLEVQRLAVRASGKMPNEAFDIAFDAPALSISPEQAKGDKVSGTVKMTGESVLGLALEMSGLGGNSQNLTLKELKVDGTLKQPDRLARINLLSPVRWDAVAQQLGLTAIKGDVKIDAETLGAGGFEFPLIGSLLVDLPKQEISSDLNAVLNGNPLSFSTRVAGFDKPRIRLNLQADELDIDKLFPVVAATKAAKSASADPAPGADPAAADVAAQKPAEKAPQATDKPLDLSVLNTIDLIANAKVGRLMGRGVEASNLVIEAKALKGRLDVTKLTADLYGGTAAGKLGVTSKNAFTGQLNLAGVSVGPLVAAVSGHDRLTGTGNLRLNLNTQANTSDALLGALGGTVQLALRNGVIKGFNIQQSLAQASEALSQITRGQVPDIGAQYDLSRETQFTSLDASVNLVKGVGTLRTLAVDAPLLRVTQGTPATISLVNKSLDVVANVRVVNTMKGQGGPDLSTLKGITIPVRVHGPFAAMQYGVEWKAISGRVAQQVIERGLKDLIEKELKPSAAPSGQAESADPVKNLENTLKGFLGR